MGLKRTIQTRLRKLGESTPPYQRRSVLFNLLGLQIIRYGAKQLAWHCRRRRIPPEIADQVATLERDGILVIRNFLPPADFARLRAEFDRTRQHPDRYRYDVLTQGNTIEQRHFQGSHERRLPAFRELLQEHPKILALVAATARRQVRTVPGVVLEVLEKDDPRRGSDDAQNVLHVDRHFRNVKVAFYLNDHNPANGAFVYAPGSQRTSWARWKHEYRMSVRYAQGGTSVPDAGRRSKFRPEELEHGRFCLLAQERQEMGIRETEVVAPANTLVIADMSGFHKRGQFQPGAVREEARMNFQYLESWGNFFAKPYATQRPARAAAKWAA
jgi:hypothetical protein